MFAAEKNFKRRQSKWCLLRVYHMCSLENIDQSNVALTFGTPGTLDMLFPTIVDFDRQKFKSNTAIDFSPEKKVETVLF